MGTSTSSSWRFKQDIRDIAGESDRLMKLCPVAFEYKPEFDPAGLTQYGLIAEEVAEVFPALVTSDREGRPEGVIENDLRPQSIRELVGLLARVPQYRSAVVAVPVAVASAPSASSAPVYVAPAPATPAGPSPSWCRSRGRRSTTPPLTGASASRPHRAPTRAGRRRWPQGRER